MSAGRFMVVVSRRALLVAASMMGCATSQPVHEPAPADDPVAPSAPAASAPPAAPARYGSGNGKGVGHIHAPQAKVSDLTVEVDFLKAAARPQVVRQVTSALESAIKDCGIGPATDHSLKETSFDIWVDLAMDRGPTARVEGLEDASLSHRIATTGASFVKASTKTYEDWDATRYRGYVHAKAWIAP